MALLPDPLPGGYAVRVVGHLEVVPEPPGGLIPYPDSSTGKWGYCDTLGRVWIQPHFAERPAFFVGSFGQYANDLEHMEGYTPPDRYTFSNARGELLRADKATVVVREADGSLRLRQRRDWLWQPGVYRFSHQIGTGKIVMDTTYAWLNRRPTWRTKPIGSSRSRGIGFRGRPFKKGRPPRGEGQRGALLDERGRRLTRFEYWRIFPFFEGVAEAQHTGYFPRGGIELIDRQGRKLIQHGPVTAVSSVSRNRVALNLAVGEPHGRSAILDTTGRVVRDWQPGWIKWAIPGYVFAEVFGINLMKQERQRCRLLDPHDGHVLLGGQRFQYAVPLPDRTTQKEYSGQDFFSRYYPAALVRDTTGHWGLLGADLRWILPCTAERYRYKEHILYVRVAGRWGGLDVQDGRMIIPIRYDSLLSTIQDGWLGAIRDGQPVVLYRGREVTQGWLEEAKDGTYWSQNVSYQTLRRADQAVTLIDTTARPVLPWRTDVRLIIASSYLPDGVVLAGTWFGNEVREQSWTLLDRQGKPLLPWSKGDQYLDVQHIRYGLVRLGKDGDIYTTSGQLIGGGRETRILPGGWVMLGDGAALRDTTGKEYLPPTDWLWGDLGPAESNGYRLTPFEPQVMPLIKWQGRGPKHRVNWVTRSGRKVWKSDQLF